MGSNRQAHIERAKRSYRSVSEFMSQKLDLITLHGMVKEGGGSGGSP